MVAYGTCGLYFATVLVKNNTLIMSTIRLMVVIAFYNTITHDAVILNRHSIFSQTAA